MTNEVKMLSLNSQRIYKICKGFIETGLKSKWNTPDASVYDRRKMKTEQEDAMYIWFLLKCLGAALVQILFTLLFN